jgi:formate dehydrogenase subunit beta
LIDSPDQLSQADPFAPIMLKNMAILVDELTREYPQNRFGAVLRPCELRALIEMKKHNSINLDQVFLIGIECLGTFPADDYSWRAERKAGASNLTREILKFARQGGIFESRYRMACQMCDTPTPSAGDLHIAYLGLPVNDCLLVSMDGTAARNGLDLQKITDGPADEQMIQDHQAMVGKIAETRKNVRRRVTASLEDRMPSNVRELTMWMAGCGACQQCLNECPICSIIMPQKLPDGYYEPWSVIRWLASCADCGMCEQACPNNLPLSAIFGNIRRELSRAYGYSPGRSIADPLPN